MDFFDDLGDLIQQLKALWIILSLALLAFRIFAGVTFYKIAEEKGFARARFFWFPFLLGVFGAVCVAALPDRKMEVEAAAAAEQEVVRREQSKPADIFQSGQQRSVNTSRPEERSVETGATIQNGSEEGFIFCTNCGIKQKVNRGVCFRCGVSLH